MRPRGNGCCQPSVKAPLLVPIIPMHTIYDAMHGRLILFNISADTYEANLHIGTIGNFSGMVYAPHRGENGFQIQSVRVVVSVDC